MINFNTIIYFVSGLVVLFVFFAVFSYYARKKTKEKLRKRGVKTVAKISNRFYNVNYDNGFDDGFDDTTYDLQLYVTYIDSAGKEQEASLSSNNETYELGDELEIIYLQENPNCAYETGFED